MSVNTGIEWTDATWNPIRGCSRISPGCENCYAETMAARFSGKGQWAHGFALRSPARWTRKVELAEDKLDQPLHWRKPLKIFVNSTSDLFHEFLPEDAIEKVFAVMANAPQHTFQVLTKRAVRMADFFEHIGRFGMNVRGQAFCMRLKADSFRWPLPNVWLGVSVEDQQRADERIPHLLRTPAAVRFLSCEPLLGPVRLSRYLVCPECKGTGIVYEEHDFGATEQFGCQDCMGGKPLHWVIVGGESGPGARPMRLEWARSIVEQCKAAGVSVFVKQLGANPRRPSADVDPAGFSTLIDVPLHLSARKGGDMDEWPSDLRVREFPR